MSGKTRFRIVFLNGLKGNYSIQDTAQPIATFYNDIGYPGSVEPLVDLLNDLNNQKEEYRDEVLVLRQDVENMKEEMDRLYSYFLMFFFKEKGILWEDFRELWEDIKWGDVEYDG